MDTPPRDHIPACQAIPTAYNLPVLLIALMHNADPVNGYDLDSDDMVTMESLANTLTHDQLAAIVEKQSQYSTGAEAIEYFYGQCPDLVTAMFRFPVLAEVAFRRNGSPIEIVVRTAASEDETQNLVDLVQLCRKANGSARNWKPVSWLTGEATPPPRVFPVTLVQGDKRQSV